MSLYAKLLKQEQPVIPIHQFQAAAGEYLRGNLSAVTIRTHFQMTVAEGNEALTLIARVQGGFITAKELDDVLLLAQGGMPGYNTVNDLKTRLGIS